MSGICGWIGEGDHAWIAAMLSAIEYRGDTSLTWSGAGRAAGTPCTLGYRFWRGRPGKAQGIFNAPDGVQLAAAGSLAPIVTDPAAALDEVLRTSSLGDLDGAFAAARFDPATDELLLLRDPFGVRSLYYAQLGSALLFASELKQLLAVPELPVQLDAGAIHKYLTFSFVPGESVPIAGIKRLLPGHLLRVQRGELRTEAWFQLREQVDESLHDRGAAVRMLRGLGARAVQKRLHGEPKVGLYLSGGIDSSAVAHWLQKAGAQVQGFSLDFGSQSVEREQAQRVAQHLGIPLTWVPVQGADLRDLVSDLVWKLDLPFGDAVTGPQYMLGRAARAAGLSAVWNGEGGDQLFGGWTSKPMIAAAAYDGVLQSETPEEQYLRSYHRFYGLEDHLYTQAFKEAVGGPGQRRAMLTPYLQDERTQGFLNRVRLADLALKGSQNILPRAERISNGFGLDARVPLFDRQLAEASFRMPMAMKLHGACEKYVLKLAMQEHLPEDIIWRRKFGMGVPISDWLLGSQDGRTPGAMRELMADRLSARALATRGLFRAEYVATLQRGQDEPFETRRRRIGEKLWALLMLEEWLRVFIDGRGRKP
jgi:asparagine synthase (glutamine-hydrolysing)